MTAELAALLIWMAFLVTWYGAMLWTSRSVSRISAGETGFWLAGFVLGFMLLFSSASITGDPDRLRAAPFPYRPLWPDGPAVDWILVAAEFGFLAFAWWARVHLGKLWSGMITLREGHRVIDTGPYRLVRHPIYTGFIGASWTYALIRATPGALVGAAILTCVMSFKAKREERFLRRELGPAAYDAYAARTPMIVPFIG